MPLILWLVTILGLALFVWPFAGLRPPGYAPGVLVAVGSLAILMLFEAATRRLDSRKIALLAALAALDAALRLLLVSGFFGFSPIFFLILCAGFAFGPSYGFLVGGFSLLVSAVATGGVGPWLPYEMFAAGWVGAAAGIFGRRDGALPGRRDVLVLAVAAFILGYLYGAATDVFDWTTYLAGSPLGWSPGLAPAAALARFGRFYVLTSLFWDSFRAVGSALMVLALGGPVLAALARFRARFSVEIVPLEAL